MMDLIELPRFKLKTEITRLFRSGQNISTWSPFSNNQSILKANSLKYFPKFFEILKKNKSDFILSQISMFFMQKFSTHIIFCKLICHFIN